MEEQFGISWKIGVVCVWSLRGIAEEMRFTNVRSYLHFDPSTQMLELSPSTSSDHELKAQNLNSQSVTDKVTPVPG